MAVALTCSIFTSCAGDQKALDGLGNKMWGLAREFSDDASVLGGLAAYFDELPDGHELKGTALRESAAIGQ
jgi:hypothetical protein